ncbi:MAG: BatA domain-containing protein [Flavobacteriaceae bacterium]|nr:BatA domain-containing protein [Flavobacteriaceae bacterium]
MAFLHPAYLWGLLGLAIPIAIHLWSKKEGQVIKIGSVQLLKESDSKQTSSISPNEFWLLLLRLCIVALVVICMAEPTFRTKASYNDITYLIEPSLLSNNNIKSMIDTLEAGNNMRLLQSGFPIYADSDLESISSSQPNYWQLAQELDQLHTDSLVVFTNGYFINILGARPTISSKVNWVIIDNQSNSQTAIFAERKANGLEIITQATVGNINFSKSQVPLNSKLIHINASKDSLALAGKLTEKIKIQDNNEIRILYHYEPAFTSDFHFIKSAIQAISIHLNTTVSLNEISPNDPIDNQEHDLLIWLSKIESPNSSGAQLLFNSDSLSNSLFASGKVSNRYYLTKHLNTEISLKENLAEHILSLLDQHKNLYETIQHLDTRIVSDSELQTHYKSIDKSRQLAGHVPISKWLWLILVFIICCERILASVRKQ